MNLRIIYCCVSYCIVVAQKGAVMLIACFLIGFLITLAGELDIFPATRKIIVWIGILLVFLVGGVPFAALMTGSLVATDGVPGGASIGLLCSIALVVYVVGLILPLLGRMAWEKMTSK